MALIPVVEGAGGVISDWLGQPLTPDSDGRIIAAANDGLLEQAVAILNQ
jgi:myo-inositol-1(or 4)-monophosphatase